MIRPGALALALWPGAALACDGITRHFVLCSDGTPWAGAEWDQFGDGVTVRLGALEFDSVEDWAGRHEGEAPTVEAALARVLADPDPEDKVVDDLRDGIETPHLRIARAVQGITFAGDPPVRRAWMLAEGGGHRVLLILTGPGEMGPADLDRASREVAALVRPAGGG